MLRALTFPQLTSQVLNRCSQEPWEPFKVALIKFLTIPSLYCSPHFYPKISVFFLVSTHFPHSQIREKSISESRIQLWGICGRNKIGQMFEEFPGVSCFIISKKLTENLVSRLHLGGNPKGRWAFVRMVACVSVCISSSGEKTWEFSVTSRVVATSRHETERLISFMWVKISSRSATCR